MTQNRESPADFGKIEDLIRRIEATGDPQWHALAVELVQVLMSLHGEGIGRMLDIVRAAAGRAGAAEIIERFSRDELVGQLLVLYNLHPQSLEARVHRALQQVRPMLHSHGGDVELLGIDQGIVRLRLEGNCHGCPSSELTLKNAIETAIYEHAADVAGLEVVGVAAEATPAGFVPLETVKLG